MIRHTVVFRLRHAAGSAEEAAFLEAAISELTPIPGVERFEALRQVSPKSTFTLALFMEFADAALYEGYNVHPAHVGFVQARWIPEVEEFQELDYELYDA
jgi:hypothetical protein